MPTASTTATYVGDDEDDRLHSSGGGQKPRYNPEAALHGPSSPRFQDMQEGAQWSSGCPPAQLRSQGSMKRKETSDSMVASSNRSGASCKSRKEQPGSFLVDGTGGRGSAMSVKSGRSRQSVASARAKRRARLSAERIHSWPDAMIYNPRSLYCLRLRNPIRMICIACIEWKWWDRIVLFFILLNTVQLAMFDPFDVEQFRPSADRREVFEWIGKVQYHNPAFQTPSSARLCNFCAISVIPLDICSG